MLRGRGEKTRVMSCCAEKFTRYPSGHFSERAGRPRVVRASRKVATRPPRRGAETFVFLRAARSARLASVTIRWCCSFRAPFLAGPRFSRIDGKVGLIPARDRPHFALIPRA